MTKVGETLGIPQAIARRDLANGTPEERSAAARKLFQYQLKEDANSDSGQIVADALAEVAKRDPKGAEKILQILDSQQKQDLLVQNASAVGGTGTAGLLLALAGVLASQGKQQSGDASGEDGIDPTTGVPTWTSGSGTQVPPNAVTMAAVAAMIAIIDPKLASGLYGTPIAQQDNLPLTTPAEDPALWKPGSTGYGADGKVELPVSTGGSEAQPNGAWDTGSPPQQIPSPGSMHAETPSAGDFEKGLFDLPPGERVARVKEIVADVASNFGMKKDGRLTRINGRDVYVGSDGYYYAVDTQHGRFEKVDKRGRHLGEVDIEMNDIANSKDSSGGHDLKVN